MSNGMFYGRNGSDHLSVFLVAIALVLVVAASVIMKETARAIVSTIAVILVALSLWRMLSKNTGKRRAENEKFLSFFRADPDKKRKKKEKKRAEAERKVSKKTHRYFRCPECKKELRVPKGKGKIKITCPHCGHQFIKKT